MAFVAISRADCCVILELHNDPVTHNSGNTANVAPARSAFPAQKAIRSRLVS
jgi:hypothetical protein